MNPPDQLNPTNWGKLSKGQRYGIVSVDVDRALARANLKTYEAILVQYLRERSWGTAVINKRARDEWPDASPIVWNRSFMAGELCVPGKRLSEAKSSLVAAKIIIESQSGLLLNKNAQEWIYPDGSPRLDNDGIRYALSGQNRRTDVSANADNLSRSADNLSATADSEKAPIVRNGGQPCPQTRTTVSANADNALIGTGAELDLRRSKKNQLNSIRERGEDFSLRSEEIPPAESTGNPIDDIPITIPEIPYPAFDVSDDIRAMAVHGEVIWPGLGMDMAILGWATQKNPFPQEWIRQVLTEAREREIERPQRWINKVLDSWRERGGPPPKKWKPEDDQPRGLAYLLFGSPEWCHHNPTFPIEQLPDWAQAEYAAGLRS